MHKDIRISKLSKHQLYKYMYIHVYTCSTCAYPNTHIHTHTHNVHWPVHMNTQHENIHTHTCTVDFIQQTNLHARMIRRTSIDDVLLLWAAEV